MGAGRRVTVLRSQDIVKRKDAITSNSILFLYGGALNREYCHQLAQRGGHCAMAQKTPLLMTHLDVSRLLRDNSSVYGVCS